MNLGNLVASDGARKKRKRLGRGTGSGHGKTSTRGHKGQKARAGGFHKRGFEGGQMPLSRRMPKRGFVNPFRTEYSVINVGDLNDLAKNTVVDDALLKDRGFVKNFPVKILGGGDLTVPLVFRLAHFSESAKKKITASGGSIEETLKEVAEAKSS